MDKIELLENWEVSKFIIKDEQGVTTNKNKIKNPEKWQMKLVGIYPSYDEAKFILSKAQKNEKDERLRKRFKDKIIIPKAEFSIRKTDNPVTTLSVSKYIKSDVYIKTQSKNGG